MPTEHKISTLKINKLTDAQYNSITKSASELYLTPDNSAKFLSFTNITASTWVADNTYADYGYKCDITCTGVTANDYAQVNFGVTEADSGDYATICLTSTNTVTIYGKVNTSITIPSIIVLGA